MRKRPEVEPVPGAVMPAELQTFSVDRWTDLPAVEPAWWAARVAASRGSTLVGDWPEHRAFDAALAYRRAVRDWRRANGLPAWEPRTAVDW